MWYLYLDESGDLGFDLVNKKSSKFFTITILVIGGVDKNRELINSVKKTIKRKLHKKKIISTELKGSKTSIDVKKYFYEQCKGIRFSLYSITLNKRRVYEDLLRDKERIYNFIARHVMDKVPFETATERVALIVDKSKTKPEVGAFNSYIVRALQGRLDPNVPIDISHRLSHESHGLQACDLFCWGIFRRYERKDSEWYDVFAADKIKFDDVYLSQKK